MPYDLPDHEFDVSIVGGGLTGSLVAFMLGSAGYRVSVTDRSAQVPSQFRVEKVNGGLLDVLKRIDLLPALARKSTYYDRVVNVRRGRVLDETRSEHYGTFYDSLVQLIREEWPTSVHFSIGRVIDVQTGPDHQNLTLASGDRIKARLVVLATGMMNGLTDKLEIHRRVLTAQHSVSFGFSMSAENTDRCKFPALTYYGEAPSDQVDYLSIFPIGEIMRANLFTFRNPMDPWVGRFMHAPKATLLETLPRLRPYLAEFEVVTPVQSWAMDLCAKDVAGHDGIVVVGDAFQTSCPAAGVGAARLALSVERLCNVHLPRWMSGPHMDAKKMSEFYSDEAEQRSDRLALKSSHYRRKLTIDAGPVGMSLRAREFLPRWLSGGAMRVRGSDGLPKRPPLELGHHV